MLNRFSYVQMNVREIIKEGSEMQKALEIPKSPIRKQSPKKARRGRVPTSQIQVFWMLKKGFSREEICEKLKLSQGTLRTIISRLNQKGYEITKLCPFCFEDSVVKEMSSFVCRKCGSIVYTELENLKTFNYILSNEPFVPKPMEDYETLKELYQIKIPITTPESTIKKSVRLISYHPRVLKTYLWDKHEAESFSLLLNLVEGTGSMDVKDMSVLRRLVKSKLKEIKREIKTKKRDLAVEAVQRALEEAAEWKPRFMESLKLLQSYKTKV